MILTHLVDADLRRHFALVDSEALVDHWPSDKHLLADSDAGLVLADSEALADAD